MHLCVALCAIFVGLEAVAQSLVTQDSGVLTSSIGDAVTLHCNYTSQVAMHFSWYRQKLGSSPVVLSTVYKYETPSSMLQWLAKYPRFAVQRQEGINHLHISDVQPEDSALYFCGSSHSNIVEFGQGVFLSVQEANNKQVLQEPAFEVAEPGASVTLNCSVKPGTCTAEHSVYWVRHGSRLGILHINGDQCKHSPTPGSQSCMYHLQKINVSSSDTGTYFCAVTVCGEILFGNGTVLEISSEKGDPEGQIRVLVWLSIIRMGAIQVFVVVCLIKYLSKKR